MTPSERLTAARGEFFAAAAGLNLNTPSGSLAFETEFRQLLVDLMDATEQSDSEDLVIAAHDAVKNMGRAVSHKEIS